MRSWNLGFKEVIPVGSLQAQSDGSCIQANLSPAETKTGTVSDLKCPSEKSVKRKLVGGGVVLSLLKGHDQERSRVWVKTL